MLSEVEDVFDMADTAHAAHSTFAVADPQTKRASTRCSGCVVRSVCMPLDLSRKELDRLDALICSTRMVRRGEALYRANDAFQSIYTVRTGSFKSVVTDREGREQVIGFHLVGETLGLDGVCTEHHRCDAIALEDSSVCIIPFRLLEGMCREIIPLQHHVHRMMSGEIVRESRIMMLLGTMTAAQRVAAFLLNLSQRLKSRGYSASEFYLRMSREEMGSYLGLKLETVSRMFSKLKREGIVQTSGKEIRIVDFERLQCV